MSKMSTDLTRLALNGSTVGTRWSVLFYTDAGFDSAPVRKALQSAVEEGAQMSTWRPDNDLMRLNAEPVGEVGEGACASHGRAAAEPKIGRALGGTFDIDIGMDDAVAAWGCGPESADADRIGQALAISRLPAHEVLELDLSVVGSGRQSL